MTKQSVFEQVADTLGGGAGSLPNNFTPTKCGSDSLVVFSFSFKVFKF